MQKVSAKQGTRFYKLHGAGNDLLVVAASEIPRARASSLARSRASKAAFVRRIADRRLGVGCDQVIELLSRKPLAIQIWNQDGSQAEMCANGSRTFLYLAHRLGWLDKKQKRIPLRISGKLYEGRQIAPGNYELCLGTPEIEEPETLRLGKEKVPFTPVRTGNPHAVVWMTGRGAWKEPRGFDFWTMGAQIEAHSRFPRKTNVEFIRSVRLSGSGKTKTAEVLVEAWERGAGATLSCGSGAVAVAALVRQRYGVSRVKVRMTSFVLQICFEGEQAFLSGPCALVAEGRFFL